MNWDKKLSDEGIIWRYPGSGPHAALSQTKKHSDLYFNSDYLVSNTRLLREACLALFKISAERIKHYPDWIITYPPFGLNIGFCLAELYEAKFGYIKSLQEQKIQCNLQPDERVLLCADDLISGSSMRKVINAVGMRAADVITPIIVVANLSGESYFSRFEIVSLVNTTMNIWDAATCPLCAKGSPAILARDNWQELLCTKV